MGDFALIEGYIDTFRKTVSWRPDFDDVVAELTDHLMVSVETEIAIGVDPIEAQRMSLDRFGEPRLVSRAFASTHVGGVAVPTVKTRRYGLFGMIGAVAMLGFFIAMLVTTVPMLEREGMTGNELDPLWQLWVAGSFLGFAGVALLILGIKERHGGTMGRWAWVSFGLAAAAAIVMIAPWMVPVGALLAGLATLIAGSHMLGEGRAPRFAAVLFSSGLLVAMAAWIVIQQIGVGVRDYWGDPVLPRIVAYATVISLFVPGYFLVGRWLYSETAVEEPETPLVAS